MPAVDFSLTTGRVVLRAMRDSFRQPPEPIDSNMSDGSLNTVRPRCIPGPHRPPRAPIAALSRAARTAADRLPMSYAPWCRRPFTKNVGVPAT